MQGADALHGIGMTDFLLRKHHSTVIHSEVPNLGPQASKGCLNGIEVVADRKQNTLCSHQLLTEGEHLYR